MDDDHTLNQVVAEYLRKVMFDVVQVYSGKAAVEVVATEEPDLIVLDLTLPGMDGIEVCRTIRKTSDVPIIMLTARDDEVDKVLGLGVGADDYMTKPFSPRELVARVQAILRRRASDRVMPVPDEVSDGSGVLAYEEISIDVDAHVAMVNDVRLDLTRTQFDLLVALAANPRRVCTREYLLDTVWGAGWIGDSRIVDTHMARLRRQVSVAAMEHEYIETVRGVGYRLAFGHTLRAGGVRRVDAS